MASARKRRREKFLKPLFGRLLEILILPVVYQIEGILIAEPCIRNSGIRVRQPQGSPSQAAPMRCESGGAHLLLYRLLEADRQLEFCLL